MCDGVAKRKPKRARRLTRWFLRLFAAVLIIPVVVIAIYRIVPPPGTPLMVIRVIQGEGWYRDWTSLDNIGPAVPRAVAAAEDNLFCTHNGFDWGALRQAIDEYRDGRPLRGASTISMQTARNTLLWTGGGFVRKAGEAYVTLLIELLWDKRRIMEVYLNIAEWGPGIYGAEAAAQTYFGRPASALSAQEAALMASVLPNPRVWSPARPTDHLRARARAIARGVTNLGPLLDCLDKT
ncbi:MAG: monofunctional biosynthetic peptidoglycan transglycosylase [Inquilinaceae bacterium]